MLKNPHRNQAGIGLIELMIAMVVGFILVGGALYLGNTSMRASRDNIRMSFINQELRDVLYQVTRDLKRASYWGGSLDLPRVNSVTTLTFSGVTTGASVSIVQDFDAADVTDAVVDRLGLASEVGATLVYLEDEVAYRATITDYDPDTNTYTATLQETFPNTVLAANGGAAKNTWTIIGPAPSVTLSGNCAIFSYDQNGDGLITNASPDERIGYRYDATDDAVEIRSGGGDCAAGGWVNITDDDTVEITAFTITNNSPDPVEASALSVRVREYTITISGQLKSDSSIERTVRETVRVRNNEIFKNI